MASAVDSLGTVEGRVDRAGRLVAADAALDAVQREAGGVLGGLIALPQLAVIARLAFRLGVMIERPAILATEEADIHCWVRALPDGDEVQLNLENWAAQPGRGPRFAAFALEPDRASVAEQAAALGWSSDRDLKLTDITPALAGLLGLEPAEAVGMPLTRLLRLAEDDDGDMPIISALAARRDFVGQRARGRIDERVDILIDGEALHDPAGLFQGFRGKAHAGDSAATRAAPTIPPAPRHFDSSFEDVLRRPIDRIVAEAEKIAERSDGPLRGDYAGYGADIAAAARHLQSVLSAMGDDPEFGRGLIDIAALAAEAVVLVEPIAEGRNVAVVLETAPPIHASGEEHAVIQILVNLLVNAIRHSPPDSLVTIGFSTREGWSSATVADQGAGIAAEDQKRIFERFERADELPGGTGLGLAIARRLARSMGGEVSLDSATGKGARFTLSLPIS
ncbi:MAG: HAMP domain-containing sensor histidine kinase [Sphingomicrobium sp.]